MKYLYLHVGVTKTGTTAIQKFLFNNRNLLIKRYNTSYPESNHPILKYQHHALSTYILDNNHKEFYSFIEKNSQYVNKLVLSSESFIGHIKFLQKIETLKSTFDSIKVIVYVRRQDLWLESMYRQLLRTGRESIVDTFDSWLNKYLKKPIHIYTCDWIDLLDPWINSFGRENIIIRPYEKSQFPNGDIIQDFLGCLNIPVDEDFIQNDTILNRSYNIHASEMYRILNYLGKIKYEKQLIEMLFDDPMKESGEVYLSYDKRMEIINHYEESNRKIAIEFLNKSNGKLFSDALPTAGNYPPVFKNLKNKEIIHNLAAIIKTLNRLNENIDGKIPKSSYLNFQLKKIIMKVISKIGLN